MENINANVLSLQNKLAEQYRYKPLPAFLSQECRSFYKDCLPSGFALEGSRSALYTSAGSVIANGYERIVIGDYGAFVEISADNIVLENIIVKKGQEFRINDPQFSDRVKYHWLTAKDNSDCKIYFQQRKVDYADYKPGFYYVSPYEVSLSQELSLDVKIANANFKLDVNFEKENLQLDLFDL